jgi:hypothetical protein
MQFLPGAGMRVLRVTMAANALYINRGGVERREGGMSSNYFGIYQHLKYFNVVFLLQVSRDICRYFSNYQVTSRHRSHLPVHTSLSCE